MYYCDLLIVLIIIVFIISSGPDDSSRRGSHLDPHSFGLFCRNFKLRIFVMRIIVADSAKTHPRVIPGGQCAEEKKKYEEQINKVPHPRAVPKLLP